MSVGAAGSGQAVVTATTHTIDDPIDSSTYVVTVYAYNADGIGPEALATVEFGDGPDAAELTATLAGGTATGGADAQTALQHALQSETDQATRLEIKDVLATLETEA